MLVNIPSGWEPCTLKLVSGSSRFYAVTFVDTETPPQPVPLSEVTNIVWLVLDNQNDIVIKKHLADNSNEIVITNASAGQALITLPWQDTAPVQNQYGYTVGSTTLDKTYTHETRLYMSDGTQEVPGSFRGPFIVYHTGSYGVV